MLDVGGQNPIRLFVEIEGIVARAGTVAMHVLHGIDHFELKEGRV
jgi:hypothetical protein